MSESSKYEELMGPSLRMKRVGKVQGLTEEGGTGAVVSTELKTVVTCDVEGYFTNCIVPDENGYCEVGDRFEVSVGERFAVGEGDTIPGIELPLRKSTVGDTLEIFIAPKFAFGPIGRPAFSFSSGSSSSSGRSTTSGTSGMRRSESSAIPPDSHLFYRIVIRDHWQPDVDGPRGIEQGMAGGEDDPIAAPIRKSLQLAELRRECGNRYYKWGHMAPACRCYIAGAKLVEENFDLVEMDQEATRAELVAGYTLCMNNLAAALLTQNEFLKAREALVALLEMDNENVKALIRAGRASIGLSQYHEADACLSRALELEPENAAAKNEKRRLTLLKKEYKERSKAMARSMSKSFSKPFREHTDTADDDTVTKESSTRSSSPPCVNTNDDSDEAATAGQGLPPPDDKPETVAMAINASEHISKFPIVAAVLAAALGFAVALIFQGKQS